MNCLRIKGGNNFMQERSDKKLEHLKSYVVEIAMLEFIKDNNLIDNEENI